MHRVLSLLIVLTAGLLLVGSTAGCADLQATKGMAATIDTNAVLGQKLVSMTAAPATGMPAAEDVAVMLDGYAKTAIINPFVYMFDRCREILCTAKVYQDLQVDAALALEFADRWGRLKPEDQVHALNKLGQFLVDAKRWKDGQKH